MTRFVIVQPHLEFGGAERQTVLLANSLVRNGHHCCVVLHDLKGGLLPELDAAVEVHGLGIENHLATPLVAFRLKRVLRSLPPSYVIVKLWSSILACYMVDRFVTKHTYNYCEDLDPSDHAQYIRFGRLKQRIIGHIFRNRDELTANTHTVADSMIPQYKLTRRPGVISSAVDPELIRSLASSARHPGHERQDELVIVSVGSLIPRKGLQITFDAIRLAERKVTWHIVGEGPLRREIESWSTRLSDQKLVVHGGLPNPYGLIESSDLLIHSALSEAFGIVILEALALGVPVIAAGTIGPTEMYRTLGKSPGILTLYTPGDAAGLAAVLSSYSRSTAPPTEKIRDYAGKYALARTTDAWIARATRLMPPDIHS